MELVKNMLSGDRVALAKLMSILEREPDEIPSIMEQIHSKTGSASLIGITGPPGAGKGTQALYLRDYLNVPHIS